MKYNFLFVNRNAEDGIFFLFIFLKQMASDEKKTKNISTILFVLDYVSLLLCFIITIRISIEEQPYSKGDYSDERLEIVIIILIIITMKFIF